MQTPVLTIENQDNVLSLTPDADNGHHAGDARLQRGV